MSILKTGFVGVGGVLAALGAPMVAHAEDQASSGQPAQLEEVLVTATKKTNAEKAQDVPIAITAISGAQIERMFAKDIGDVGLRIPNVRFDTVGSLVGVANFSSRGMGFLSGISSDQPTVGLFVDGQYLGVNYGALISTFDIGSIEVLRGPQGTLFGRNVTGGAVVITTQAPTGKDDAEVRAMIGNGFQREVSVAVDKRLSDAWSVRLVGDYKGQDGLLKNVGPNGQSHNDFYDAYFVRPSIRFQPNDSLDIIVRAERGQNRGGGSPSRCVTCIVAGKPIPMPSDHFTLNQDVVGSTLIKWTQWTAQADWKVGPGTLTSISAQRRVAYEGAADSEGAPIRFVDGYDKIRQHQTTQELRYAVTTDRFDLTFGAYYFEQKVGQDEVLYSLGAPAQIASGRLSDKSAAVFAQSDWRLTDELKLTTGIRFNTEKIAVNEATGFTPTGNCDRTAAAQRAFVCTYAFQDAKRWRDVSPKVVLEWKPNETFLTYASYSKGFRSGGYNIRNRVVGARPGPYEPEHVDSYELGAKSEFLDRRARLNVSAFYNDFKNMQRTVLDPASSAQRILNAAAAKIRGIEVEFEVVPTGQLKISGNVGYLKANFSKFDGIDLTGDGRPDPALAKDLKLERAIPWTGNITAEYAAFDDSRGRLSGLASYTYTDKQPVNTANTFFLKAYRLLDANIVWKAPGDKYSISIFGKNLTNAFYRVGGLALDQRRSTPPNYFDVYYVAPPRTYGVMASYKF